MIKSIPALSGSPSSPCWSGERPVPLSRRRKGNAGARHRSRRSLEGNLEGDSPDRPVVVYLPPATRRLETGATRCSTSFTATATAEAYVKSLGIPDSMIARSPPALAK